MRDNALPITLIVIGLVSLAWYFGIIPDRSLLVSGGFIVAGVAVLVADGLTKTSVVSGPFLIAIGIAWWLHDNRDWSFRLIIPVMLVLLGVLMIVARSASIPERKTPKSPN
ncbi:MAG: hypothetical protein JSR18_08860 [Proteobacteria bacterium]|nr:hypothetical protein [Pseudomonadota bacterium]